jgi:hypothetical protein
VAGGELESEVGSAIPTKVDDLKEFFVLPNGSTIASWMDASHLSKLSGNSEGSWGVRGVTKGYDSIWNVEGTKFPMQVAYNANAVSSGSAYLRVDIFVFWSPELAALTNAASRVTLSVTNEVVSGHRTIYLTPSQAEGGSRVCTFKVYKAVIEPIETLSDNAPRIANLERYVNTRSETLVDNPNDNPGGIQYSKCAILQMLPPPPNFNLSFFASGQTSPFAALERDNASEQYGSAIFAWVRSGTGVLVAKSALSGVSLSFLETYLGH